MTRICVLTSTTLKSPTENVEFRRFQSFSRVFSCLCSFEQSWWRIRSAIVLYLILSATLCSTRFPDLHFRFRLQLSARLLTCNRFRYAVQNASLDQRSHKMRRYHSDIPTYICAVCVRCSVALRTCKGTTSAVCLSEACRPRTGAFFLRCLHDAGSEWRPRRSEQC